MPSSSMSPWRSRSSASASRSGAGEVTPALPAVPVVPWTEVTAGVQRLPAQRAGRASGGDDAAGAVDECAGRGGREPHPQPVAVGRGGLVLLLFLGFAFAFAFADGDGLDHHGRRVDIERQ